MSLLDYASPVFFNCGKSLDRKLHSFCKRAFRIIHGRDVAHCDKCNFDIFERRKLLAMNLFRTALFFPDHVLHDLLPPVSARSNRLVLPHARTTRRVQSFIFSCALKYNECP